MKKILKWNAIVFGGLIGLTVLAGWVLYPIGMNKLTRTYPNIAVETVNIPTGVDAIDRGKHVAIIWACTRCHGDNLSGALLTSDPFEGSIPLLGTIPVSNLTSGKGGIAKAYTDADWMRAIRHGVKPDGRAEIFMFDYSMLSDRDLGDLLAYLKQIPPIDTNYPAADYGPIIPIIPAVGIFAPVAELIDHNVPHPADPMPGVTAEYGKYLSGICLGCHGNSVVGRLKSWKQEDFVHAFHGHALPSGKQLGPTMSSKTFSELNDTELAALWLYFQNPSAAVAQK